LLSHRRNRRLVLSALGVAICVPLAGIAIPEADAGVETTTLVASYDDTGATDTNRDGRGDETLGRTNKGISAGEMPRDGDDLRFLLPFTVSSKARAIADAGGTALLQLKVWRVDNLGTRSVRVDGWAGDLNDKSDYERSATTITSFAPVVGVNTIDISDFVRNTQGSKLVLRIRLSAPGAVDGKSTQFNFATGNANVESRRPRIVLTGVEATPTTGSPGATTATVAAAADTYVSEETPATPHGDYTYLRIGQGSFDRNTYVHFDVDGFSSVASATLRVHADTATTSPVTIATAAPFDEQTMTWNDRAAVGAPVATISMPTAGAWTNVDVTAVVAGDSDGGIDLALSGGPSGSVSLSSRESGSGAQLVVTGTTGASTSTVAPTTAPSTTVTTAPPATTATTLPPTTTTTAPPGGSTGGEQPPDAVTGGANWTMVFADEFDSSAYTASKWSTGMRSGAMTLEGNTELQWYQADNSAITPDSDGSPLSVLQMSVDKEAVPGQFYTVRTLCRVYPPAQFPQYYNPTVNNTCSTSNTAKTLVPYQYTSGMLNSAKSFAFRYGYVETRVKMPKGFGMWPAIWLRDWQPWAYEIDVMEGFDRHARVFRSSYWWPSGGGNTHTGTNLNGGDIGLFTSGGFCRAWGPTAPSTTTSGRCSQANSADLSAAYHTIGFEWTPTKYAYYLDGVKYYESAAGANVDQAYNHLILNLAFGNSEWEYDWTDEGIGFLEAEPSSDAARFAKTTVEFDYVRVWQAGDAVDVCTSGNCPG
jgi:beta-glucanase (GH16 family)